MADELTTTQDIKKGKDMAVLSWAGLVVGIPLFIIPFLQNESEFALFHARQALVAFVLSLLWSFLVIAVFLFIVFITCGFGYLLFPVFLILAMLPLIPVIDGLIKASNGRAEGPVGIGDISRMFFPAER